MKSERLSFFIALACVFVCSTGLNLGGYNAGNDVKPHSDIDKDVKAMEGFLEKGNFAAASNIYSKGKNSKKTSGLRTLQGFSTDAPVKLAKEKYYKVYQKYWKSGTYADRFVSQALKKQGDFKSVSTVFRAECALKGAQYQNVWMYIIHEMEDAVADCKRKALDDNDGGVKAWDEAVAFYAGGLIGPSGKDGYLLYTLAEKRCKNFGTCAKKDKGTAKVNTAVISLFKKGQKEINSGQCSSAEKTKDAIIRKMTVPLVQGCLRYIVLTVEAKSIADEQKAHSEGYAFCSAILPLISRCNKGSGTIVVANFTPKTKNPMKDGVKKVADAVYKTLGCMGVSCSDVGKLTGLPPCKTSGGFKAL